MPIHDWARVEACIFHSFHLSWTVAISGLFNNGEGIHGEILQEVFGKDYVPLADKPLTLASYESQGAFRAYVEPVAVSDQLPDMPLFLRPGRHVKVPLENTYQAAWKSMPAVWKEVIEAKR